MYGSLLTEDTYKRADAIYKSISEEYNTSLKEYILSGKQLDRNETETSKTYKTSQAAAIKMGIAATSSPGSKDVGKCIMDITETFQEVNLARETWLQKLRNDMFSMERKCDQDVKFLMGLRKKAQDEFKSKTNDMEKAFHHLSKLKKRTLSKTPSRKTEEKIQKATDKMLVAKTSCEMVAHEMLERAFSEERKRYCFFVERQCTLIEALLDYHQSSFGILQENLEHWKTIAASEQELLSGAVGLIEGSRPRQTNVSLDELDMNMGISRSSRDLSDVPQQSIDRYSRSTTNLRVTNLRRTATTKETGSLKEVDIYNPYQLQLPRRVKNSTGEDKPDTEDDNSDGRSSVSSSKLTYRKSWESGVSQTSTQQEKHDPRISLNDSGISVDEVFIAEQEAADRRRKQQNDDNVSSSTITVVGDQQVKNSNDDEFEIYESLYDYTPENDSNKMSLKCGDRLVVSDNTENSGWMFGKNQRSGEKSWFPKTYVELVVNRESDKSQHSKIPPPPPIKHDSIKNSLTAPTIKVDKEGSTESLNSFGVAHSPKITEKDSDGRKAVNVFQFAKNMENPFEEIKLRKSSKSSPH